MHRNDLLLLLMCAAITAAIASNPPLSVSGVRPTLAALWTPPATDMAAFAAREPGATTLQP